MTATCDVAILGAGPDGLAAAIVLARAGLACVVVDGAEKPGGIAATREFHPGFRASPWTDELAAIPADLHWSFDLARRGAIFVPSMQSTALWPDRRHMLDGASADAVALLEKAAAFRAGLIAREQPAPKPNLLRRRFSFFRRKAEPKAWPGELWSAKSLHALLADHVWDEDQIAHLAARALCGRCADPFLAGSALHLLAPGAGESGLVIGGLARLADALVEAATEAGAEIRCGLDAGDVKLSKRTATGIVLADGAEIGARAVISTLDVKRTFLSLFHWQTLPDSLAEKAGAFRMAGSTARILVALSGLLPGATTGPISVAPDLAAFAEASLAWRAHRIADNLPVTLRFPSLTDPGLAPAGAAVMTATLGAVPAKLFDGGWTREKRDMLRDRALAAAETVLPGLEARVIASETITPNDIETAIGATDGDLWGGEISPDQMFGFRPWPDAAAPRTPVGGLYLGGPSTSFAPFATCVAGVRAARAVLADLKSGEAP